jgi:hypothetical protein
VRKKILETYAAANDLVVAEGKVEGGKATLTVPKDLKFGEYIIKVWSTDGGAAVGSARIQVEDADEPDSPGKK